MYKDKKEFIRRLFTENRYFCDHAGNVFANYRRDKRLPVPALMRPTMYLGYKQYSLHFNGLATVAGGHQIVLLFFGGDVPSRGHEINHKDGQRGNNALSNLEVLTSKQNVRHAFDSLGRSVCRGEKSGMSKLSEKIIRDAQKEVQAGRSIRDVSKELNINNATLARALRGETWAHLYL